MQQGLFFLGLSISVFSIYLSLTQVSLFFLPFVSKLILSITLLGFSISFFSFFFFFLIREILPSGIFFFGFSLCSFFFFAAFFSFFPIVLALLPFIPCGVGLNSVVCFGTINGLLMSLAVGAVSSSTSMGFDEKGDGAENAEVSEKKTVAETGLAEENVDGTEGMIRTMSETSIYATEDEEDDEGKKIELGPQYTLKEHIEKDKVCVFLLHCFNDLNKEFSSDFVSYFVCFW